MFFAPRARLFTFILNVLRPKGSIIYVYTKCSSPQGLDYLRYIFIKCSCLSAHPRAKKPAKVLLFFDMTKYFCKKMQKKFVFLQNAMFR